MNSRFALALGFCFCLALPASAQVVRFETTMGDFDMVLNPTNNPLLTDYAQNMVNYVEDNKYKASWINRADTGFVLQMGGFYSNTKRPPPTIDSIRSVIPFNPVDGHPASTISGLSNTVGTVALALPGDGNGGTDQNAGTSSFFVNLTSNTFLDADFTVFAAIPDMTVINNIMALTTIDRTADSTFGAGDGNLGFAKVPLQDDGLQVFLKRAFIVSDTLAVAKDKAGVSSVIEQSLAGGQSSLVDNSLLGSSAIGSTTTGGGSSSPLSLSTGVVPEPASGLLALISAIGAGLWPHRRGRRKAS